MKNQNSDLSSFLSSIGFVAIVKGQSGEKRFEGLGDHCVGQIKGNVYDLSIIVNGNVNAVSVITPRNEEPKALAFEPTADGRLTDYRGVNVVGGGEKITFEQGGNDIRFAVLSLAGEVRYIQVSLVNQDQTAWVVIQEKSSGQFFRSTPDSVVECTNLRTEIANAIAPFTKECNLPTEAEATEEVAVPTPTEAQSAIVLWYDECRQAGMVLCADGATRKVHFRQCARRTPTGRKFLVEGETVYYRNVSTVQGRSEVKEQILGVTLQPAGALGALPVQTSVGDEIAKELEKLQTR